MDDVQVTAEDSGTQVRLRRRLATAGVNGAAG